MKYCTHCGAPMEDEAVVCVKCGCAAPRGHYSYVNSSASTPSNNTTSRAVDQDDKPFVFGLVGFLVPIAGLILFILWHETYPRRAKAAGLWALISVIIGVVFSIIAGIIVAILALENGGSFVIY